jgi:DNA-binding beta-propeller fold protein YncE
VFVADQSNNRVVRFTASGAFVSQFGYYGYGPGRFDHPVGLGFDASQNLYVTDQFNNRVQKFTHDGTFLCEFGSYGDGAGEMFNPWAVLPLPDGVVFVADTWNHRIQVWGAAPPTDTRRHSLGSIKARYR